MSRWNLRDPDGEFSLQEMIGLARTKDSGWVDYKDPNPGTGRIELKTSPVESFGGWLVGCGTYK